MKKIIPLLLVMLLISFKEPIKSANSQKFVIGYIFVSDTLLDASKIPANKFTHINYAFANIKNGKVIEGFKYDTENYKSLNSLKGQNPELKIIVSVGGWTWSGDFSDAALTKKSRSVFAKSARNFLVKHKLDGIDIDWEYPNQIGANNKHRPEDIKNFTLLMKELRKELDEQGELDKRHYITSAACGAGPAFIENTEMGETQKYMDFVNVMTYDFCLAEVDSISGHHSSLYTNTCDPKKISADASIRMFMMAGVPSEKLVMGFPFYGRAWGNVVPENNGLYQKGSSVFVNTMHSAIVKDLLDENNNYQRYWDDTAQAPYLWNSTDRIFITYDDIESVSKKCYYIEKNNLQGAMFWAYGGDYENIILNALNLELRPEACDIDKRITSKMGAGFRFSSYGSRRVMADSNYWINVGKAMAGNFEGSTPECVWIVGILNEKGCKVSFPEDAKDQLIFGYDRDLYESTLDKFDKLGFRVWLQVEPGFASVDELIYLILKQYSHHKCITGVGIDVEWYNSTDPDHGQGITDQEAERWLKIAKSFNDEYRIFFKHWLIEKMPPTYRDDIVFINDGQMLNSLDHMLKEFIDWGRAFYPAGVGFQFGYPSDRKWWRKYENPPHFVGKNLLENIPNTSSLFWVDFSIADVFPPDKMK